MPETSSSPFPPPSFPPPSITASPDPAPQAVADVPPGPTTRFGDPITLFVIASFAALAAAVTVGGVIGVTIGAIGADSCSPNDGWCELGAVLMGFAAGIVSGAIAYLVTGITVIRRRRPAGRRAGPIVALIVAPPLTLATLGFLGELLATIP